MNKTTTPPARKRYRVWGDCTRCVYQEVEARTADEAYRLAAENPDDWEPCSAFEDGGDYRLTGRVQDTETDETFTIREPQNCTVCGSVAGPPINDTLGRERECGACERERNRASLALPMPVLPTAAGEERTPLPAGPWTEERWTAARADSRWATERWAADLRSRFRRYPTLHAEEKIRLAMDILWDVNEHWDHDALTHYPPGLPSFDEYLTEVGGHLYEIRWSRPSDSPATPHGDAA